MLHSGQNSDRCKILSIIWQLYCCFVSACFFFFFKFWCFVAFSQFWDKSDTTMQKGYINSAKCFNFFSACPVCAWSVVSQVGQWHKIQSKDQSWTVTEIYCLRVLSSVFSLRIFKLDANTSSSQRVIYETVSTVVFQPTSRCSDLECFSHSPEAVPTSFQ